MKLKDAIQIAELQRKELDSLGVQAELVTDRLLSEVKRLTEVLRIVASPKDGTWEAKLTVEDRLKMAKDNINELK